MKKYRSMKKTYYDLKQKPDAVEQELIRRREGVSSIELDFKIGDHPAFIVYCDEVVSNISALYRICRQTEHLIRNLPTVATAQYIRQALIEEIHQTNEMENVHSTRKEIRESMERIESGGQGMRFEGMIRKYNLLLSRTSIPLKSCQDMRALYDSFILDEVRREDEGNVPDGVYFRSQPVGIHDKYDRRIHEGVFPEAAINECMEHALAFLNDEEYDLFIRIAAFHYLFGYIHPFYDGNGRMTRFISSYMLSQGDVPMPVCLRLSYVIKECRKDYYSLFKDTNDRHNYADMTAFVIGFLNIIRKTGEQTVEYLQEIDGRLESYAHSIRDLKLTEDQGKVLFILIQLSVCSDLGMGIDELMKACGIGRNKLLGILKNIEGYCCMFKEGNKHLYRADLNKLDELMEQRQE